MYTKMHTYTHTHTHTNTTHIHVECISACTEPSYHKFYFVSNFNSYDIVIDLKGMEINAIGTLQSNRTKHCPLLSSKDMKKNPKGSYDCSSERNVEIVTWNGNAVVTLCSDCEGLNPLEGQNGIEEV